MPLFHAPPAHGTLSFAFDMFRWRLFPSNPLFASFPGLYLPQAIVTPLDVFGPSPSQLLLQLQLAHSYGREVVLNRVLAVPQVR
jgi:hypothetical protein